MDLKSGYPFWAVRNGLMHAFPPLRDDLQCDVLVVGGGITGALIANELCAHGHDVAVIEQRDIGWGSTAASTALLQYEIDTHLIDLARQYGEAAAVLAYQACADAIPALREVARGLQGRGLPSACTACTTPANAGTARCCRRNSRCASGMASTCAGWTVMRYRTHSASTRPAPSSAGWPPAWTPTA